MYTKELAVLNTVTALGADLNVSVDGNTYITNVSEPIPSSMIKSVSITQPVTAVAGVITVTPTAANSTLYKFTISAYNTETGNTQILPVSYLSASSGDSATTICNAFREQINNASGFSVTATGTATLILTGLTTPASGTTPYVTFAVGGSSGNVSAASGSGSATPIYPNVSATRTTQSVVGYGLGSILLTKFNPNSSFNLNYAQASNIVAANSYAEVDIQYVTPDLGLAASNVQSLSEVTVLVNTAAANSATLISSWGTLSQLALGYKSTIVASGANVGFASNVATRASGSFVTEGLKAGDVIAVSDGVATTGSANVLAAYSTGAAAGVDKAVIDNAASVTAGAAFVVKLSNIPL